MNKEVTIDGVLYREVLPSEIEGSENFTAFYGLETECGTFEFHVLLDDSGDVWEDTSSVEYKDEYWDNSNFLKEVLSGDYSEIPEDLPLKDRYLLINLLKDASKRGWL